ncbi:bifunctional sugar phosphate isomerase/epimerase/4-hydroxyphenylpyruvate dioxygenase family protein [Paraburkholderia sp. DHOC27]|uniref:bifunctional sugar phosphate isomerase/epimerase/4-hydroxyphenylpyruvate dioxygenase family protein n=1 Tax=Paraburkholderia sp. DHOC27 TaxID=2303330 RepID=UPI000E3D76B9|nr:sugar phosphate isomerase/epimerase and 4-hydroxyphenylpyruvate domain-containing protein [Paraburkholderia sp. DHOC27]RFU44049.1 sugar phosphate isomerase/epimerase and 4-hydroxyphenylpyruvate domain-containing protein [Paraburkholderia sp. DHOC27]
MQRSIATVSISGTLVEKLTAIQAAGFDGVEIFENDLLYFDGSPADVRRIAADLGLKIMLFQPFRDFEGVSPERLVRNLDRVKRKFDLMHELGTDRILVCSSVAPDTIGDDALIVEQLDALARAAQEAGVFAGYEALAWGRHVNSYRHAWRLVNEVNHANLGLVLDSFHTLSINDPVDEIASIPGERITFVQIADAPKLVMDVLEWSRHYRCFPGQGDFDVAGFTARVMETGYQGPLSLEIFNDGFRAAPTAATAADGHRSLLFLEEQTRTKLNERGEPAPQLYQPPPAPAHIGFQFLEFAVDGAARGKLADWLGKLQFHRAGQHRSKDVTLYQHGNASLVLNAEADSFASAFFQQHGLSLCASALRVDVARLAFERAAGFGYTPFSGQVGPNERVLPAVRAPDGSLNYFVDETPNAPTLFQADFVLEQAAPSTHAALLRDIDHVVLSLPADALDTWVLYFRTALGFEAEPSWLVPDPYGLVRSRALRSRDGSVRIALNASLDRHTAVAEALHTYRGSGLNHVAFSSGNIFAALPQFVAAGLPILRIPRNYYEDLAARYALPDDTLEALRANNILYDRDEHGGEFFHAYTEPLDQRFFLEIVQRKGGYDGYGAANAAVRLAAQAQLRKHEAG